MSEQVDLKQVREAFCLLSNTEQRDTVLQMADELEALRAEVEDLETPPSNAMQVENETAMMHDELEALRAEEARLLSALELIASGKLPHYQNQSVAQKTMQGADYEDISDGIK